MTGEFGEETAAGKGSDEVCAERGFVRQRRRRLGRRGLSAGSFKNSGRGACWEHAGVGLESEAGSCGGHLHS